MQVKIRTGDCEILATNGAKSDQFPVMCTCTEGARRVGMLPVWRALIGEHDPLCGSQHTFGLCWKDCVYSLCLRWWFICLHHCLCVCVRECMYVCVYMCMTVCAHGCVLVLSPDPSTQVEGSGDKTSYVWGLCMYCIYRLFSTQQLL